MINDRDAWLSLHLERVSRSFAFCIARLEAPLRQQVGLAYLICRLLDSIEDSDWSVGNLATNPNLRQQQAFDDFICFLKSPPKAEDVMQWSDWMIANAKMPSGELDLVKDAHLVFAEYWRQNQRVRDVMSGPIESMARGMKEFRGLSLRGLLDVNRYCFFVAGVVGEILTGLVRLIGEDRGVKFAASLSEGFRFGLFLQKVNLLKDQEVDLKEGRNLVPSRVLVFRSAFEDAKLAFSYLKSIPTIFEGYRLFCGWSLFIGLASLPHIASRRRISRIETVAILAMIERRVRCNSELEKLFSKYLTRAESACAVMLAKDTQSGAEVSERGPLESVVQTERKAEELQKYRSIYVGHAQDEDLCSLFSTGT